MARNLSVDELSTTSMVETPHQGRVTLGASMYSFIFSLVTLNGAC